MSFLQGLFDVSRQHVQFAVTAGNEALLAAYTPFTLTTAKALRRELAETRRRGFALATEEMSLGAVSCAAPIIGPGHEVVAAVSVVVPTSEVPPRKWSATVMAAASGIAQALGRRRAPSAISAQLTGT